MSVTIVRTGMPPSFFNREIVIRIVVLILICVVDDFIRAEFAPDLLLGDFAVRVGLSISH